MRCDVAAMATPTISLKKDRIIYSVEPLGGEIVSPSSGGNNLWTVPLSIAIFGNSHAANYICETKFGNDVVQSRTLPINILGGFQ